MIAVACSQCHKKLKVKADLAGKKVRCPGCRELVAIPAANDDATVPPQISPDAFSATPMPVAAEPPSDEVGEDLEAGARYHVGAEIARGGMGAIVRAVDQDIHREVAVKFLLNSADTRQQARFVEEAQITGQLEHPNIVPIHQLGVDKAGRCFFSMKMVKGKSLAEILKQPGEPSPVRDRVPGPEAVPGPLRGPARQYTLNQLLNIFASICNAMAYAHSRNVIHRDLKPANIMVGDFGEVYVMDWGLAKVLGAPREPDAPVKDLPATLAGAAGSQSGVTTTTRESVGDLTQAGSIMGTPAYMPPEQAQGADVDMRADIYSLGAILYEMMTLTPPVGRGGDMMAIIMRVVEGKIDDPAKRAPERAQAGWVPLELSAVAMKALATKREDRYQTVEALQRDIQLFLEGRSVSAKQDSRWEQFVKLVKRNKGLSVGLGVALVVLLGSLGFLIHAWIETGRAYTAYQKEQEEKLEQAKRSVPAFLKAARLLAQERQSQDAMDQVTAALNAIPDHAEARFLKAQLHLLRKEYPLALAEFEKHQTLCPEEKLGEKLAELCRSARTENPSVIFESASLLFERKDSLASLLVQQLGEFVEDRAKLLPLYQKQVKAAWPGQGIALRENGRLSFDFRVGRPLDLTPLRGIPLSHLYIRDGSATPDLGPLKGMPLDTLGLNNARIKDLTPLKGMPLTYLALTQCEAIHDLSPLAGMRLTLLRLEAAGEVTDLSPLAGMPLTDVTLRNCAKVTSLEPLRGMKLTKLFLSECSIQELAPLKGMPLENLHISRCRAVTDFSPLKGSSVTNLIVSETGIASFSDLAGLKLTVLGAQYLPKWDGDLTPLRGMPLKTLHLTGSNVSDLTPLKEMPLEELHIASSPIEDLSPVRHLPITYLVVTGSKVRDLTPVAGMKLTDIHLTPANITKGMEVLRGMKTLNIVNDMPVAEFWKRYDAGEFKKK